MFAPLLACTIVGILENPLVDLFNLEMSSASREKTNQPEVPNSWEIASSEPTVPLSIFKQLHTRLEQLELSTEQKERCDAHSHKGSDGFDRRRRGDVAEFSHDAQCRLWRRWFSAQQSPQQDVQTYYEYLDMLVEELHDQPGDAEFYWRLRTSIKPSIRDVLDRQVIQPKDREELLALVLRIERNEKPAPTQDSSSRQPASQSLPADRRPNQTHASSRPQGRVSAEADRRCYEARGHGTNGGRTGSGGSSRRRRDQVGRRQPRKDDCEPHLESRNRDCEPPLVDREEKQRRRENNLCFECGAAGHKSSERHPAGNKPADDWSIPWESRPSDERPSKSNNTTISWDPPPQPHIERFQSQKEETAQSKGVKTGAITYSSKEANLNQSRWSPAGNADTVSLLD